MNKYVDIPAIIQVIGSVFKDPSILDNTSYKITEYDFPEKFHRILFGSIYNLHLLGVKNITINAIEDYLNQRPKAYAMYKTNRGSEYLQEIVNKNIDQAFDYYYNRMKKMTLLRGYNSIGLDLSWLYDVDNIFDTKKKQEQENYLDNHSLEELDNAINNKITYIRSKYMDGGSHKAEQAGNGMEDLLDNLQREPAVGYPLYGALINGMTRGARLKKFYLRSAPTGVGKAIPNSTVIPTPAGDKRVDQIKVGDYLFDAFGNPTLVKGVYPQGKKQVWEIIFKDGRRAKCCDEHLWSYCTAEQREESKEKRQFYTRTLKEINQQELYRKEIGYEILVPMQRAVKYPKKTYHIEPYSFGLLLGNESFRYDNKQKVLSYNSKNEILSNTIEEEINSSYTNTWVEEVLKNYSELWNVKSENKFIPIEYLEGGIEQRFNLLNGLLDSNGSIDKEKGRIFYYTISPRLKDDVYKLVLSLGFKATVLENFHKDTGICYCIEIIGSPEEKIKLFKLKRKKDLILQWFNNGEEKEKNTFNPIVEINNLDYKEEMTCFMVDNSEHLFLMNDFIVTHNTRAMIADACNFACNEIYKDGKWTGNGTKEPTLYISTEQERDELQTMMLAFVSNVDEEHILNNHYNEGEYERIKKASQIINDSPIYIKTLPNFTMEDIENTIKSNIKEYGIKYICYDYIHSSLAILSEISSKAGVKGLREDNILFMISTKMKDICNEYGVFILSATQLNGNYQEAKIFDQNLLRGAKAIGDKIDVGMLMFEVTPEDIEGLRPIISSRGLNEPDIKIVIYKNRGNRYKNVFLWCKNRKETCRIDPMYVTDAFYRLIPIEDFDINVIERE